jgi:hypothetical protein
MRDTRTTSLSFAVQAVSDITYEPVPAPAYQAVLEDSVRQADYRNQGIFLFTNVSPGFYNLLLSGNDFQNQSYPVSVPLPPHPVESPPFPPFLKVLDVAGENELIVVVTSVNPASRRITFTPEIIPKDIHSNAPVHSIGFRAQLAVTLDPGLVSEARLTSVDGLGPGSIVRIVRGESVRLRFNPYFILPDGFTRIAGKIVRSDAETSLPAVQVRLTQINGFPVVLSDVETALVAVVDVPGAPVVFGTQRDIVTTTNDSGDFNFYSSRPVFAGSVRLQASCSGFLDEVVDVFVTEGARNVVNFALFPA